MARLIARSPARTATLVRRGPWLALGLTLLAVGVGSNRVFELAPRAVVAGEWWRIFTCHLVHFSSAHAVGDIVAFAVWAGLVEAISRRLFVTVTSVAAFVVGVGVLTSCPAVRHYGGLSALDVALATTLLCVLATSRWLRRVRGARFFIAVIAALHVSKAVYELAVGKAVLAPDLGAGVTLLPAAHLFGAAAGVLGWLAWWKGASLALDSAPLGEDGHLRCGERL